MKATDQQSSSKQNWRTPPHIFHWLDDEFLFTLDAAASDDNALCSAYFTEQNSALTHDWIRPDGSPHSAFVNPPYGKGADGRSLQAPFWEQAFTQWNRFGVTSLLLVPPRIETPWWHDYGCYAAEIRLIRGRISFVGDDGLPVTGNTFGSCLVIFGPHAARSPKLRFVNRPVVPYAGIGLLSKGDA